MACLESNTDKRSTVGTSVSVLANISLVCAQIWLSARKHLL